MIRFAYRLALVFPLLVFGCSTPSETGTGGGGANPDMATVEPPDLLMPDLMLPPRDPTEFYAHRAYDPEYAERIFVIFQRLHPRTSFEGTGIGLAMCRKIVEYHGGRMWLDTSHEGPGSRFCFTLPGR